MVPVHIPRLAKDALVVIRVTPENSTVVDPYYVSVTYDQGSVQYPNFNIRDVQQGRFPDILVGRSDTLTQVIILTSVLSFVFFFIAIANRRIKEIARKGMNNNLFWVIPAAILASIFVLFVCEVFPMYLLRAASILVPPVDVRFALSYSTIIPGNIVYTQGTLILGAFVFCAISWLARWLIGYLIAKQIILRSHTSSLTLLGTLQPKPAITQYEDHTLRKRVEGKRFLLISLLLVGTPIQSFLILFFNQSVYNFSTSLIFILFLVLDIVRMLILILAGPKISGINRKFLYYPLLGISVVGVILNFFLFALLETMLKGGTSRDIINAPSNFPLFYDFWIFTGIIGVLQLVRSAAIPFVRQKLKKNSLNQPRLFHLLAFGLSVTVIASWVFILAYVTSMQHPILRILPYFVLIGVVTIVLESSYLVLSCIILKEPSGVP